MAKNELFGPLEIDTSHAPIIIDEEYHWNVGRMTVMWSAASFGLYLLNFLNKYLEGTIYWNNYVEVTAAFIAVCIGARVYASLGQRACFVLSYLMSLIGGLLVYVIEAEKVDIPLIYGAKTKE